MRCSDERDYSRHCKVMAEGTKAGIEQLRTLFVNQAAAAGGGGGEDEEGGAGGPVLGLVQDLPSLNRHVFNQAGIELGEYGAVILQKSLKQLS